MDMEIVRGRIRFAVIPVVHGKKGGTFGSIENMEKAVRNFQPRLICVEADNNEMGGGDEEVRVVQNGAVTVGIDVPQISTRRRLATKFLMHPWEALRAFNFGRTSEEISDANEANEWRIKFQDVSPIAFETIYTEREGAMVAAVSLAI